jgi:hypothetical protein
MSQAFNIYARWSEDTSDAGGIGTRLLETFRRLEPLAPVMRNWFLLDGARGLPVEQVEPQMAAFVAKHVQRDDYGKPERVSGYGLQAYGWTVPRTWDARTVRIRINAGSTWWNEIEFEIGDFPRYPTDFSLVTYPVFKAALKAFAAAWPLPWALARAFDSDALPVDAAAYPDRRRSWPFEVAWIAYLSAPLAKNLSIPPQILTEPTAGGGVVLSALETRIDQMNPDHMRCSRMLEQILRDRIGVGDEHRDYGPAPHPPRAGPY